MQIKTMLDHSQSPSSLPITPQAEDPSLTQPLSQKRMKEHQPVSQQYSELLVNTGILAQGLRWPSIGWPVDKVMPRVDGESNVDLASRMAGQKLLPGNIQHGNLGIATL